MSQTVTLQLSETEYRTLVLCYTLGDLIKDSIEQKSEAELQAQMQLHQKLDKAPPQQRVWQAAAGVFTSGNYGKASCFIKKKKESRTLL